MAAARQGTVTWLVQPPPSAAAAASLRWAVKVLLVEVSRVNVRLPPSVVIWVGHSRLNTVFVLDRLEPRDTGTASGSLVEGVGVDVVVVGAGSFAVIVHGTVRSRPQAYGYGSPVPTASVRLTVMVDPLFDRATENRFPVVSKPPP